MLCLYTMSVRLATCVFNPFTKVSCFCGNPVFLTTQSIQLLRESHKKFVFVEDWNLPSLYDK